MPRHSIKHLALRTVTADGCRSAMFCTTV